MTTTERVTFFYTSQKQLITWFLSENILWKRQGYSFVCSRELLLVNIKVFLILQEFWFSEALLPNYFFLMITLTTWRPLKSHFDLWNLRKHLSEKTGICSSGDAFTPRSSMGMISSFSNNHQGMEENNACRENNSQQLSTLGPWAPSSAPAVNACSNQGLFFTTHRANSYHNNPTGLCAIDIWSDGNIVTIATWTLVSALTCNHVIISQ